MTDSEHESVTQKIEAADSIRQLKARYGWACDNGYKTEEMAKLFADDAVFDGGEEYGRQVGVERICAFFEDIGQQITWARHHITCVEIDLSENLKGATGIWYQLATVTFEGDDGPESFLVSGVYHDRYERQEAGWKFAEVISEVDFIRPVEGTWT